MTVHNERHIATAVPMTDAPTHKGPFLMSDDTARIEPQSVVAAVEDYVTSELTDAARYDNRKPLDESGIWSLHALAARIYAAGWDDAEQAITERERRRRNRDRDVG